MEILTILVLLTAVICQANYIKACIVHIKALENTIIRLSNENSDLVKELKNREQS